MARMQAVHLIGIGGVGMSALAQAFLDKGWRVGGSDRLLGAGTETPTLATLRRQGVALFPQDGSGVAPGMTVVYSTAIEADNPDLSKAKALGLRTLHRSAALAALARGHTLVAVTGTCGKSSVTALLGHLLAECGRDPFVVNGAEAIGWEAGGARVGSVRPSADPNGLMVAEADESDRSLMALDPTHVIVTNVFSDHFPKAEAEALFRAFEAKAAGHIIDAKDEPPGPPPRGTGWETVFDWRGRTWRLPMPGAHNVANAKAALAMALALGCEEGALGAALASFRGVRRRLERVGTLGGACVVDDYAHHPTELAASLKTMRELYPGRRLVVVFQPHRYARLKQYFHEFASELSEADEVFITPVFAAWTQSGTPGSSDLARAVGSHAHFLEGSWEDMAGQVFQALKENDLAAVIGAGDIKEMIGPLRRQIIRISDLGLVIAAGGSSTRFGRGNKLFCKLNGMPVFVHCLRRLLPLVRSGYAVMSVPEELKDEFAGQLSEYFPEALPHIRLAVGGKTRTESVRNALAALPVDVGVVAVHDAARPLVSADALIECVRECRKYGGAVSARRSSDTVKETDEHGFVVRTVPREGLWTVQTPQVFQLKLLRSAYEEAEKQGGLFTDDASLVENFTPAKVKLVENRAPNIKITYPEDLLFAEACLKE